jgi:hypothetical protein
MNGLPNDIMAAIAEQFFMHRKTNYLLRRNRVENIPLHRISPFMC